MSQQEFMPQSQASTEADEHMVDSEATYVRPLPRSDNTKNRALPKSEHPSTYEELVPPYSYPAQDRAEFVTQTEQAKDDQQEQPHYYRDSGHTDAASEATYRSRNTRTHYQAPWWARPQQNSLSVPKWVVLVLVCLILLPVISLLIKLLSIILFGLIFLILLPLLIIFALVIAFIALVLFKVLGLPLFPRRRWTGRMWRW